MEYVNEYRDAVLSRTTDDSELEKVLLTATTMALAGVDPARIYAFCKTGIALSRLATPQWREAIQYFNSELK